MSFGLLLAAATTVSPTSDWKVDLIWGCKVTESGRSDYLVQGRLMSADDGNGGRRHAMQVLKDGSGRLEGYVAQSPYYVTPRAGEHWVIGTKPHNASLILKFKPMARRGVIELGSGSAKQPEARGTCEFEDKA